MAKKVKITIKVTDKDGNIIEVEREAHQVDLSKEIKPIKIPAELFKKIRENAEN